MHQTKQKRRLAALWLALLAAPSAHAEDLLQAYRAALANDPVFAVSRHNLDIEKSRRRQAGAVLGPTLNVHASANDQRGDAAFGGAPAESRTADLRSWSLQLTQPLFRYRNWHSYVQAQLQVIRADAQLAQAQQELMLRVAQAYFDILIAQENLAATEAEQTAIGEQLKLAKRNFDVKAGTITDVHEAQSRFDLAHARYLAAVEELETRRGALEQLTGQPPAVLSPLKPDVSLPRPQPSDVQSWLDAAQENNPNVHANRAALEAARREIDKNRAEHYPTLDLTASYGNNYSSGSLTSPADVSSDVTSTQVGVQLTVPLFASGAISARVAEAIAARDRAQAELEAAKRNAIQTARQAYYGVTTGVARTESLKQAVRASQSSLEGNKIGQRVGTRINIDVLNAQQQLAAAQRDLARARYETVIQVLRLKAAAGSLNEDDLKAMNAMLAGTAQPQRELTRRIL